MKDREHRVIILVGSNIAPQENIQKALYLLRQHGPVESVSTVWENPPVGTLGPNFLNLSVAFRTPLSPDALKAEVLRRIEDQLGRVRTSDKYAPRTIDLDIILYDDTILEPRLWAEAFIAIPVADICPTITHPVNGETLGSIAQRLRASEKFLSHPEIIL